MGPHSFPTKILKLLNKDISRSIHQRCSIKKGVLRNFAKFTGKSLCQSVFFNKAVELKLLLLASLFNLSRSSGIFPNILKTSKMIRIHKNESKLKFSNCWPISLLSYIDKILYKFFEKKRTYLLFLIWFQTKTFKQSCNPIKTIN